jgi:hypothetical protein
MRSRNVRIPDARSGWATTCPSRGEGARLSDNVPTGKLPPQVNGTRKLSDRSLQPSRIVGSATAVSLRAFRLRLPGACSGPAMDLAASSDLHD